MIKAKFIVDLKQFSQVSLISRDSISQTYLIKEKRAKKLFAAKILNIHSSDFSKKISNELLCELTVICDSFPLLFSKFRGISLIDFNKDKHPVLITENIENGTLQDIIQNENSSNYPSTWNDTKKLINIYGIAYAFLFLSQNKMINLDLNPSNIYETSKFYPKINIFSISKFDSQKFNKSIDFTSDKPEKLTKNQIQTNYSNDILAFSKIVYFIITGDELNDDQNPHKSFLKQIENYKNDKKPISERYKRLLLDCISLKITFESILHQLKKDQAFITKKINQKEFSDYVHKLIGSEEEKEEINKKSYLRNISYLDLTKYEKIEKMSKEKGSSAIIYKVKNKETNDLYFGKIIKKKLNEKSEVNDHKTSVLGEVIIHSHINYPSFVKFIGYSSSDFKNRLNGVILTEYLKNGSLGDLLQIERDGNEIPFWDDTMKLINIYGIASSISYLHSQNIIHCDLKPGNIYLDDHLFPRLGNFSQSKITVNKSRSDSQQIDQDFLNSVQYMAPEIIIKDKNIKATDVYSFGIIVYQILTKRSPFIGTIHNQILMNLNPDIKIPKAYAELIEKCCDEAPKKRPTILEIVNNLKTNSEFITKNVNKELYYSYIKYIDNQQTNHYKFIEYSLEKYYDDYKKIMSLKTYISDDFSKRINIKGFKKLDVIGQGAFGKVCTIQDEKTGKIYAAKKLCFISNSIEDFKNRILFTREVSILSVIKHPSIIKFIGYSPTNIKDKPKPVIAFEYMKNGSLNDILSLERFDCEIPFWDDTLKLINIYGIASAMSYLHSKNIIHRDLKPENILLDDFLFPHLSDFGLSKFLTQENSNERHQINSYVLGTVQFMAPEIFVDLKYSKESDVYAFAMIVYQMFTKECPFYGFKKDQILYNILFRKIRPKLTKSIPKGFKKLIELCWHQEPSKRPSFEDIVNQLKTDSELIPKSVNQQKFKEYVEFIENQEKNDVNEFDCICKSFMKYSLDSIKEEFELESCMSSGQGFVKIYNFQKVDLIEKNEDTQVFEVEEPKTGIKCTATVSKYIEKFDKEELCKISQEVKQLSEIKHPTIQQFIGFSFIDFNHRKKPVIFNENCSRKTLFDILENERKNEPNPNWNKTNKLILIYGIAFGMNLLHSRQIFHPNLNPKNIFVDDSFHPKLGEVGFYIQSQISSKASSRSSSQINFYQFFVAPEILENKSLTLKSDVYSFAFIVFEILTGQIPFENSTNPSQVIFKIVNESYRPEFKNEVPEVYRHLIEECWLQNPDDRPSFSDVINELENNQLFITDDVNKTEYFDYINSIKNSPQDECP